MLLKKQNQVEWWVAICVAVRDYFFSSLQTSKRCRKLLHLGCYGVFQHELAVACAQISPVKVSKLREQRIPGNPVHRPQLLLPWQETHLSDHTCTCLTYLGK